MAIGTIVPRRAELRELPPELFDIVPEYQGYLCADTPEGLVIVDPETLEIVDIVPV